VVVVEEAELEAVGVALGVDSLLICHPRKNWMLN